MLIRIERPSEGTENPIEVSLAHQSKSDRTRRLVTKRVLDVSWDDYEVSFAGGSPPLHSLVRLEGFEGALENVKKFRFCVAV